MQNVLFVVYNSKYAEKIAEKLAFLHIHCKDFKNEQEIKMIYDYLENAMKNKASEMAVSGENFRLDTYFSFEYLAKKYGYRVISIETHDEKGE